MPLVERKDLRPEDMQPYSGVKEALLVERAKNAQEAKLAHLAQLGGDDQQLGHLHMLADKFAVAEKCETLVRLNLICKINLN